MQKHLASRVRDSLTKSTDAGEDRGVGPLGPTTEAVEPGLLSPEASGAEAHNLGIGNMSELKLRPLTSLCVVLGLLTQDTSEVFSPS